MSQLPAWTPTALASRPWDANLRAIIDKQFSSIEGILDVARSNLQAIQDDDQSLKNGIVTPETLSEATKLLLGAGVTDHGELDGLLENHHPQYVLKNGATILTGTLVYSSHPTFTGNEQLVDKQYVDDAISGVGGVFDHGAMENLDDPSHHAWAALIDGTRALTGKASYASHPSFSADTELIDKKYADDKFLPILSPPVTESGTSFTLGGAHNGQVVHVNNASDVTVTAPATGNAAGFNCILIPINTGRILFDDDGGGSTFIKAESANLRSGERENPIGVHQPAVGTYRLWGGLEDASIKRMEVMVCGTDVDVEAVNGFNGNAFVIPDEFDGMNLVDVSFFNVGSAGSGGDSTYQVRNVTDGVDMLSTVGTIEAGEVSSLTAATPPSINTSNDDVSEGDVLRIDPKTVGSTKPKGLIAIAEFRRPVP